jgi:hypothetical protein
MARRSAGMPYGPPLTPGLKSGITSLRDDCSISESAPPANARAMLPELTIFNERCAAGEIDQHSRELAVSRMSDNAHLSDIGAKQLAGMSPRDGRTGN